MYYFSVAAIFQPNTTCDRPTAEAAATNAVCCMIKLCIFKRISCTVVTSSNYRYQTVFNRYFICRGNINGRRSYMHMTKMQGSHLILRVKKRKENMPAHLSVIQETKAWILDVSITESTSGDSK